MIFPKGDMVYENLNTSFTQLDAMLNELKTTRFTGYVQLTAPEYVGIVLLNAGTVANAVEEGKGQRRNGSTAVDGILARGRERDGVLNVFRLAPEMAQLLARMLHSELLYKDLTSDMTSLDKLVASLHSRRHSGYIEVRLPKSQGTAMIFLWEGKALQSVVDRLGTVSTTPGVQEELLRAAASEGAVFTVYSAQTTPQATEAKPAEGPGRQDHLGLWQDVLKTVETAVDAPTKAGTFAATFKRACIEVADAFPFLDPFAAEFEYRDGRIQFDGEASAADVNQGLSRCLAQTVRLLATQPGTRDVAGRLSAAANGLKKRHGTRLAEVGLTEGLPEVFGS